MNDERIKEIAEELDRAVPKHGAKISWQDSGLIANRSGLIRMAVETLYASIYPLQSGREVTDRSLDYLEVRGPLDYDDRPRPAKISRTESIELSKPSPTTALGRVKGISAGIVAVALLLFLLASTFVGCVDLINKMSK
jgi:hypothetical protein